MGKSYISWDVILEKLSVLDQRGEVVYGIPKNGMLLTAFLNKAQSTHLEEEATFFLDDVVDSGRTRDHYKRLFPHIPFKVLFDKTGQSSEDREWLVFPWENEQDPEDLIVRMLELVGEDPTREGLVDTPKRIVRSWEELYCGYGQDPKKILSASFNSDEYDEMIILKDIEFYSMCEHHMLPFFGKARVGYIPGLDKKVVGVSKLARLVDVFARRLQIQERMTYQIAQTIQDVLHPKGVGVVLEAKHLCMVARGTQKQNSSMLTSCLLGSFRESAQTKAEFLSR